MPCVLNSLAESHSKAGKHKSSTLVEPKQRKKRKLDVTADPLDATWIHPESYELADKWVFFYLSAYLCKLIEVTQSFSFVSDFLCCVNDAVEWLYWIIMLHCIVLHCIVYCIVEYWKQHSWINSWSVRWHSTNSWRHLSTLLVCDVITFSWFYCKQIAKLFFFVLWDFWLRQVSWEIAGVVFYVLDTVLDAESVGHSGQLPELVIKLIL